MLSPLFYQEFIERLDRCVFVVDDRAYLVALNSSARLYFEGAHGISLKLGEPFAPQLPKRLEARWAQRFSEILKVGRLEGDELSVGESGGAFLAADYELIENRDGRWVTASWRDATKARGKEEEIRRVAHELHEAKRTRETILAVLGHDLRSPIAQLNALLYLIRNASGRLTEASLREHLANLESTTHYLAETLENTLLWATLHRDGIQPQIEEFDAHDVLKQSFGLHAGAAERKELEILLESAPGQIVRTDRQMLAVFQRNLIANAIKYTSNQGRIRLMQRCEADGTYCFSVEDTGIGMDERTRLQLLEAEQTQSRPGTLGERGIGFGLNVCREFLEKLGGDLGIESVVGEGTRVTIRLPRAEC